MVSLFMAQTTYLTSDPRNYVQVSSLKHDVAFVMVYAGAHCIHVAGFSSVISAEHAEASVVEYVMMSQCEGDLTSFITKR